MVCLCSFCEKLPTLASWLPLRACMPLRKHSNGSKVHMFAPRGCEASSEDCPNPAERDQFGSHWRQWQGQQTQWWTKGKHLPLRASPRGGCVRKPWAHTACELHHWSECGQQTWLREWLPAAWSKIFLFIQEDTSGWKTGYFWETGSTAVLSQKLSL